MNTFTLGIQMQAKYRIGFDYYAHGRLYTDEYGSAVAVPQGTQIAVRYNPLAPEENDRSGRGSEGAAGTGRGSLIGFGIAGSVLLSLAWLLVLRGCSG